MRANIFQIFYLEEQRGYLENDFTPYDNSSFKHPFNFEYAVLFRIYPELNWNDHSLNGTVSWKFRAKTGLSSKEFLTEIEKNPGHDVYLVNPATSHICFSNIWKQGEVFHPGITAKTEKILRAAGYNTDFLKLDTPPNLTAYCNYWAANKVFWDEYIAFLKPLWAYLNSPEGSAVLMDSTQADLNIRAPLLPFVFERLFSSFLSQRNFKVYNISPNLTALNSNPLSLPIRKYILKLSKKNKLSFIERSITKTYFYLSFIAFKIRTEIHSTK